MEDITFKNILIPTDFSDLAESALGMAIEICKLQKASLSLLHVVDKLAYLSPTEVFLPKLEETPDVVSTMEENLTDVASKLSELHQVEIKGIVETGNAADTICRVASRDNFDLIVLGSHGTSGLRGLFIGSTAFKVIKHSPCPVLTIPGNWERRTFNRIIFPVRIIPNTLEKYKHTRKLIVNQDAEFTIIGLSEKENEVTKNKLMEIIDQLKLRLTDDQVKFHTMLLSGEDFASKILEAAEVYDADLITITANLDLDWNDIIVGPFARQLINHSKRPVLSIAPNKAQFQYTDL